MGFALGVPLMAVADIVVEAVALAGALLAAGAALVAAGDATDAAAAFSGAEGAAGAALDLEYANSEWL